MAVGDRLAKNLWFRVGEEASDSDVVEICYKSYHQYEQAEYFFSKQHKDISVIHILVLMKNFNIPNIGWKGDMEGYKENMRFVLGIRDKFLIKLSDGPGVHN